MAGIRDFLGKDDYKSYRNVRASAVMFVLLGFNFVLAGTALTLIHPEGDRPPPPKILGVVFAVVGLAGAVGAVGGIAVFAGSRRWSALIYVMAALYLLAFPIGTILSAVMFTGLGRYLESVTNYRLSSQFPADR